MSRDHLVPKPVLRRDGVMTTVYVSPDDAEMVDLPAVAAPLSSRDASDAAMREIAVRLNWGQHEVERAKFDGAIVVTDLESPDGAVHITRVIPDGSDGRWRVEEFDHLGRKITEAPLEKWKMIPHAADGGEGFGPDAALLPPTHPHYGADIADALLIRQEYPRPVNGRHGRVDPPGCGCTDCIVGYSVPIDEADERDVAMLLLGTARDATGNSSESLSNFLKVTPSYQTVRNIPTVYEVEVEMQWGSRDRDYKTSWTLTNEHLPMLERKVERPY